jgi:hypothetical protein
VRGAAVQRLTEALAVYAAGYETPQNGNALHCDAPSEIAHD